jgi:hypothetical protein
MNKGNHNFLKDIYLSFKKHWCERFLQSFLKLTTHNVRFLICILLLPNKKARADLYDKDRLFVELNPTL